jgi:hypothetical protein
VLKKALTAKNSLPRTKTKLWLHHRCVKNATWGYARRTSIGILQEAHGAGKIGYKHL